MATMTTLQIEGMTCHHCANRVARALKEVPGVLNAEVQLDQHTAKVETESTPDTGAMIAAVTAKGYSARLVQ